jgi:asparagine synthase (glutamine-hydrolysing)
MTSSPGEREAWHDRWLIGVDVDLEHVSRQWTSGATRLVVSGLEGSDLRIAESDALVVLFAGELTNVAELEAHATQDDAARLVMAAIERERRNSLPRFRGPFAVIAWDRRDGRLMVARDQVGLEPIFYARAGRGWLIGRSPDAMVAHPLVSRDFDAVALSEWLCGWFPAVEDTTYRDVKRVPPASTVTFGPSEARVERYWDPFPEDAPVPWADEEELEQFDGLFERAVRRAIGRHDPALFLSGGLDSIAVAVNATDLAGEQAGRRPLALSVVFADAASNEETIQTGVAKRLGLEQMLLPFASAIGPNGLLHDAMRLSAAWPQPVWNIWAPVYRPLVERAAAGGKGVILTGRGGDEWLTVSPYLLADLLGRGNLAGATRLIRARRRSNALSGAGATGRLIWRTAGRPLASAALDAVAPGLWHQRRRRRLLGERADWVAPDPAVRRAMDERIERWIEPARPAGGFYVREMRTALRHPAITHDMEETQEFGRRHGLRMMHPFWDVDLIGLLYRIPPDLLMRDGRSKWLLRRSLAERLPGLGLEKRGKASAAGIFQGTLRQEAMAEWRRLGGAPTLERIGAVRSADIESGDPNNSLVSRAGGAGRLYSLLNLEAWVQQRERPRRAAD